MARASIPVDLFNPGQVFACLGFMEMAGVLHGYARAGFDWISGTQDQFHLATTDERNPFDAVLGCLASSRVSAFVPQGTDLSTEKWRVPTKTTPVDWPYPMQIPDSPATLPIFIDCLLDNRSIRLSVDHWGDSTRRDTVKFWAGAGGYPGAALYRDALDLVRDELLSNSKDPFAVSKPQSSSFRFDWRRDYIPLDVGFSPNDHTDLTMIGFPIVEMLAAIGMSNARPKRSERTKLEYHYGVLGIDTSNTLYDPMFLRASLGCSDLGFPQRHFTMRLGWPGQENQARCITDVLEETRG